MEKKRLYSYIIRIWLWISLDKWLELYLNLTKNYYLRKSLGLEDFYIYFNNHADTIYYLDILCTEWELNLDLKAYYLKKIPSLEISDENLMELNPIYKYNMQMKPLQKYIDNMNIVNTIKSLKFLHNSNNMYPCLVRFFAAIDFYVIQENVKTYDEYIS